MAGSLVQRLNARHAGLIRYGRLDEAANVRRQIASARIEDAIHTALSSLDAPTLEQRQRLASMLTEAA